MDIGSETASLHELLDASETERPNFNTLEEAKEDAQRASQFGTQSGRRLRLHHMSRRLLGGSDEPCCDRDIGHLLVAA
jgi:hypothetical protein